MIGLGLLDSNVPIGAAAAELLDEFGHHDDLDAAIHELLVGGDAAVAAADAYVAHTNGLIFALEFKCRALTINDPQRQDLLVPWLTYDTGGLLFTAPSADAVGVASAAIDRARSLLADQPPHLVTTNFDVWLRNPTMYRAVLRLVRNAVVHSWDTAPLARVVSQLDLNATQLGDVMGASRQAAQRWMDGAMPANRRAQLGDLIEVANTLEYRLRDGMAPIVFRRPADVYDGLSMYDMFAAGRGHEVVDGVRAMFDYGRVA